MTYYAILNKDSQEFWDANYDRWQDKLYLYYTKQDAVNDKGGHKLSQAVIVEVTYSIKPVKEWVKKPLNYMTNAPYLTNMVLMHSRLTDGTLRVYDGGWEVYE